MKKSYLYISISLGVLAGSPMLSVNAQSDVERTPQAAQESTTAADRTEERRTRLQATTDLSEARVARVGERCEAAQSKLLLAAESALEVKRSRTAQYGELSQKLDEAIARLDGGTVDTSQLQTQTDNLDALIDQFVIDFEDYEQAFADTIGLSCVDDVESFILALQDLRNIRTELKSQTDAIRQLVTGDIVNTLNQIKDQLASEAGSSEDA